MRKKISEFFFFRKNGNTVIEHSFLFLLFSFWKKNRQKKKNKQTKKWMNEWMNERMNDLTNECWSFSCVENHTFSGKRIRKFGPRKTLGQRSFKWERQLFPMLWQIYIVRWVLVCQDSRPWWVFWDHQFIRIQTLQYSWHFVLYLIEFRSIMEYCRLRDFGP